MMNAQMPQSKPVIETMRDLNQRHNDKMLLDHALTALSDWLMATKGCNASVQEMAAIIMNPYQFSQPAPQPMQSFQSTGGAFDTLGATAKGKASAKQAPVNPAKYADPSFDDNFKIEGCLYVPPRGKKKHVFCALPRQGN